MREIGRIKQVQIQRSSLTVGERPTQKYNPSALLVVSKLLLTSLGAIAMMGDDQIMDLHHVEHPTSHNRGGNDISFGFTSHYRQLRSRFGDHLIDGCAGENILIESEQIFTLSDLGQQIVFQHRGNDEVIHITDLMVAAPCAPFSQYAARTPNPLPAQQMKETLQFLDHGRRGFYATVVGQPGVIQAGDRVFVSEV